MTTQTNIDQADQATSATNKLTVDFSHRLSHFGGEATSTSLLWSVDGMAGRSLAMLSVLGGNFAGDPNISTIPDDTIFWYLEAVVNEIRDIQSVVTAYQEADCAKGRVQS